MRYTRRRFGRLLISRLTKIPCRSVPTTSYPNLRYSSNITTKQNQIELVSRKLHKYLFGTETQMDQLTRMAKEDHITKGIELPPLTCPDIFEHFVNLGRRQFEPYQKLLETASKCSQIPPLPPEWVFQSGWTVYSPNEKPKRVSFPNETILFFDVEVFVSEGQLPTIAVAMSPTRWYSWSSERLINDTPPPKLYTLEHLIPLENPELNGKGIKIVIGHHVGYDRARVREQYIAAKSATRFWCTMSTHIAISGMTDWQQRLYKKRDDENNEESDQIKWLDLWRKQTSGNSLREIYRKLCSNNLDFSDVDKSQRSIFMKGSIEQIREDFQNLVTYCAHDVKATYEIFCVLYPEFCKRFPNPISFAGMLEMATPYLPVTDNWRHFSEKCEKLTSELEVKASQSLIKSARQLAGELNTDELNTDELNNAKGLKKYEKDPWMWVSEWSSPSKKSVAKKSGSDVPKKDKIPWLENIFKTKQMAQLPIEQVSSTHIKFGANEIPRIFGLCFGPYPLYYQRGVGWGFLVPRASIAKDEKTLLGALERPGIEEIKIPEKEILNLIAENKQLGISDIDYERWTHAGIIGIFEFYRLPHPIGNGQNVGTPFAKGFKMDLEQEILHATRFPDALKDLLEFKVKTGFWTRYRDRYFEQLVVWHDENATVGSIAPSIVPAGTVTRRSTHDLWVTHSIKVTSSNPKDNLIGSNLKTMVQCCEGWKLVGADVDSEEQWIAAIFGDSACDRPFAGATPFSKMLLAGDKSKQSDLHSVVARDVGISRNHAKTLNYARLYGSGRKHATDFLKLQGILTNNAIILANRLFDRTKGRPGIYSELKPELAQKFYKFLKSSNCPHKMRDKFLRISQRYFLPVNSKQTQISKQSQNLKPTDYHKENPNVILTAAFVKYLGKSSEEIIFRDPPYQHIQLFHSGYESYTFNFLNLLAIEPEPRTPILDCRLSSSLELPKDFPTSDKGVYFVNAVKRTIINWFVQSSAVDFLHMLLVCMNWICTEYAIDARLVLTIHDEVHYLVRDEDVYRCALALSITNMLVRAAISRKLGINELPKSIAFFSLVDIDTVLRKEVNIPCDQPDGTHIPFGEALTIEEIFQKTGGMLSRVRKNGSDMEQITAYC